MKIKKVIHRNGKSFYWSEGDMGTNQGIIKEEDIKKEGTIVKGHTGKDFGIFPANFDDNIHKFKREAQGLLKKDVAPIMFNACLGKDSIIVEAGTGSGILTAYLARYVKKVVSYDIRADAINLAKKNLEFVELSNVEFRNEDVNNIKEKEVDAVILDLPEPFRNVESAFNSIKQGGYLVGYLPNMTQVIDFVREAEKRFYVEKVIEVNEREWTVYGQVARPRGDNIAHTAFLIFCRKI